MMFLFQSSSTDSENVSCFYNNQGSSSTLLFSYSLSFLSTPVLKIFEGFDSYTDEPELCKYKDNVVGMNRGRYRTV